MRLALDRPDRHPKRIGGLRFRQSGQIAQHHAGPFPIRQRLDSLPKRNPHVRLISNLRRIVHLIEPAPNQRPPLTNPPPNRRPGQVHDGPVQVRRRRLRIPQPPPPPPQPQERVLHQLLSQSPVPNQPERRPHQPRIPSKKQPLDRTIAIAPATHILIVIGHALRMRKPPRRLPPTKGSAARRPRGTRVRHGGVWAPGGPPGLQNRRTAPSVVGGFDSRPPPLTFARRSGEVAKRRRDRKHVKYRENAGEAESHPKDRGHGQTTFRNRRADREQRYPERQRADRNSAKMEQD